MGHCACRVDRYNFCVVWDSLGHDLGQTLGSDTPHGSWGKREVRCKRSARINPTKLQNNNNIIIVSLLYSGKFKLRGTTNKIIWLNHKWEQEVKHLELAKCSGLIITPTLLLCSTWGLNVSATNWMVTWDWLFLVPWPEALSGKTMFIYKFYITEIYKTKNKGQIT